MTTPSYVYGVTRAGTPVPKGLTGLDDKPVELVQGDGVGAIISDLPQGRPLGERADLVAHQKVLNEFLDAAAVVVPFRFGAALSGREAVEKELLAANSDRLGQVLDGLDGRLELRLKGTYVQDSVLREVMEQEPEIAQLSERIRQVPADAADAVYYDRIRLGEMIAQALERRRDHDGRALIDPLAPVAESVVNKPPAREEDVLDAAFLIDRAKREEFESAVDKLGQAHGDRIKLRLVGPLPPYDFVPEA
ncbi:GvpL/GvpF family gas vesicle protein [Actinomadura sp. 6N118]|uniref:GvpL/GvpF family gas vesicle protein n=1 Tax=Actinomadura sp. 6N118 TaxID=3375151 RepID=UPI0037AF31DF